MTNSMGMVHKLWQMSTNEDINEPIKGLGHMVYLVYLISLYAHYEISNNLPKYGV